MRPSSRAARLLGAVGLVVVCASVAPSRSARARPSPVPVAAAGPKQVSALYLVPADRAPDEKYKDAIARSLAVVRAWYWQQLRAANGTSRTFEIDPDGVRVARSARQAEEFAHARRGEPYETSWFYNVIDDARAAGLRLGDGAHIWIIFPDADPVCGQTASASLPGVAGVLPGHHLRGLAGETPERICPSEDVWRGPCRYTGTIAHEAGHAFGLAHPDFCPSEPACKELVMYWGRDLADARVRFGEDERAALLASPFFATQTSEPPPATACASAR